MFDPTKFNFILLGDFRIPGDVAVYEFKNHPTVNGKADFLRLNLYLALDNNYVTIWFGLLEPMFAESTLALPAKPGAVDFATQLPALNSCHGKHLASEGSRP